MPRRRELPATRTHQDDIIEFLRRHAVKQHLILPILRRLDGRHPVLPVRRKNYPIHDGKRAVDIAAEVFGAEADITRRIRLEGEKAAS